MERKNISVEKETFAQLGKRLSRLGKITFCGKRTFDK